MKDCKCVIGFRGHQDQCFGMKLLFKEAVYQKLSAAQRRALFTGNGMYDEGPFWWRQVLELIGHPARQVGPHLWEVSLNTRFMRKLIPIFTLTTAVAGRRLRHDCFVVLRPADMTLQVHEHELRPTVDSPDFSAGGRKRIMSTRGFDPLHAWADPVSRMTKSSVRPQGDLVGRLGYLCAGPPQCLWSPVPLDASTGMTPLDVELGGISVRETAGRALPLIDHHELVRRWKSRGASRNSETSLRSLLQHERLWAGGGSTNVLLRILRQLQGEGHDPSLRALWRQRREKLLNRKGISTEAFGQRLRMFCRELLEYAGGDQLSRQKHMNGISFDGVICPSYARIMLQELKEVILWYGLNSRRWSEMYQGTHDSHRRILTMKRSQLNQIVVMGDIHGSIHSLVRNICSMRQRGLLGADFRLAPGTLLVCLGDYVDYGPYGTEVLWTLLWLHSLNPRSVVLLGGNHEDTFQNTVRGGGSPDNFQIEIDKRFRGHSSWRSLVPHLARLYASMPRALILGLPDRGLELQCSHGCISSYLHQPRDGGEQIAWADIHQHKENANSVRGGNIHVYGTSLLEKELRCSC